MPVCKSKYHNSRVSGVAGASVDQPLILSPCEDSRQLKFGIRGNQSLGNVIGNITFLNHETEKSADGHRLALSGGPCISFLIQMCQIPLQVGQGDIPYPGYPDLLQKLDQLSQVVCILFPGPECVIACRVDKRF